MKTLVAGTLAIIAAALTTWLLLHAEKQWEVATVAALGIGAMIAVSRTKARHSVAQGFAEYPVLLRGVAAVSALAVIFLLREENFALLMLSTVLLYGVACLGLTIQFGYAGVVNFAGAAFFGTGAYVAAVLGANTPIPHLLILLVGGVVSGALGLILTLPLLRTKGHYTALITIAFGILFKTFLEVNDALGGPQGMKVPGFKILGYEFNNAIEISEDVEWSFYLHYAALSLVLFGAAFLLVRRIERSWIGLALDAVRIDETAASAFGINAAVWKIFAFTAGNVLAGIAGALYAMMTGFVAPNNFAIGDSLLLVAIVILGGIGNLRGIFLAAAIVVIFPEKLQVIQEYRFLLFSLLVIAILLLKPEGLMPRQLRQYFPGART